FPHPAQILRADHPNGVDLARLSSFLKLPVAFADTAFFVVGVENLSIPLRDCLLDETSKWISNRVPIGPVFLVSRAQSSIEVFSFLDRDPPEDGDWRGFLLIGEEQRKYIRKTRGFAS